MERREVSLVNLCLVKECMNTLSMKEARGTKLKDVGLGDAFGRKVLQKYIPILPQDAASECSFHEIEDSKQEKSSTVQ